MRHFVIGEQYDWVEGKSTRGGGLGQGKVRKHSLFTDVLTSELRGLSCQYSRTQIVFVSGVYCLLLMSCLIRIQNAINAAMNARELIDAR